ncbi:ABC transporter substrate-binding protein [Vibrio nitrifigilis]|uniref:ABC transporter substrate-binding protein n=1 Tax=Vibrio nitrifigilis TaxID=2789781 RepID=A0ABS0GE90_9VIBR|nr:ABC transporter substrate-binding protein [Vibrio nitrifigilis]MBF9000727.1 ABC transporter substrate-binding protein [Vibrio nitrifigilis]
MHSIIQRALTVISLMAILFSMVAQARSWKEIEKSAQQHTVHMYLWAGSAGAKNYLEWAIPTLKQRYQITLEPHYVTTLDQIIDLVRHNKNLVKSARTPIDLVWLSGRYFHQLKSHALLYGPFTEDLPNWSYINPNLPFDTDGSENTLGLEAPWGVAQLSFIYNQNQLYNPPENYRQLLSYAKAFPGRVTYPKPPYFMGSLMLQSILIELTGYAPELREPVSSNTFAKVTQPLWDYLDELHHYSWAQGRKFPADISQLHALFNKEEIDLIPTYGANMLYSAQEKGQLPFSARGYGMKTGSLTNMHFLAIPQQSTNTAGALVAINFLLSPEAQSRKGLVSIWGDPPVIRSEFLTGSIKNMPVYNAVHMPDPTWDQALSKAWMKRYNKTLLDE